MDKDYVRIGLKCCRDIGKRELAKIKLWYYKNDILDDILDVECLRKLWEASPISCLENNIAQSVDYDASIIIPLYNSEKFLPKIFESFLSQKTKYRYELIFVNDGSQDCTQDIIEEYKMLKPEIVKIITQSNQGISAARNTGIRHAKGKYIGFADHDDWVEEKYIEKLVSAAYREKADIVKCSYAVVKNNRIVRQNSSKKKVIRGNMGHMLTQYPSYIWGGIYKRELLENVRFPVGYWFEDMVTRMLLFRQSKKFVDVGETLYYKLDHEHNASSVLWSKRKYKSLEQLYLPQLLIEEGKKIGLGDDIYAYECILLEYTKILVLRINELPLEVQKQTFLYAREILMSMYKENYELDMDRAWKRWNRVIMDKKFNAWRIMANI